MFLLVSSCKTRISIRICRQRFFFSFPSLKWWITCPKITRCWTSNFRVWHVVQMEKFFPPNLKMFFFILSLLKVALWTKHCCYKCLHPHGNAENGPHCCSNYARPLCGVVTLLLKYSRNRTICVFLTEHSMIWTVNATKTKI